MLTGVIKLGPVDVLYCKQIITNEKLWWYIKDPGSERRLVNTEINPSVKGRIFEPTIHDIRHAHAYMLLLLAF